MDGIQEVIAAAIVIISWVFSFLENRKKAAVVTVMTDPLALSPPDRKKALQELPTRSYMMSDETRQWILASESADDKALIVKQINAAELDHEISYQIIYSIGGYQIEYGLIKSSWRSKM